MKLYDISRPLSASTPTWPGDTTFQYVVNWSKAESGSVNVGKLTMSVHTGTHVDAPFHFDDEGRRMNALPLDLYVGAARVVELSGRTSLGAEDFAQVDLEGVERLLVKTLSWSDPNQFPSTICYLRADLPAFLAEKGVRLIGVDVPSVDPLDSKELTAHHGLHQHNIQILEGLWLDHVEEGDYELIALPLALVDADGSPVRAVLRR